MTHGRPLSDLVSFTLSSETPVPVSFSLSFSASSMNCRISDKDCDPRVLQTEVSSFEKEAEPPPPPKENGKAENPREGQWVHKAEEGGDTQRSFQYHTCDMW